MMVPDKGLHSFDHFIKSKPIKFGQKIWSLCGNDWYSYHLDVYCGKFEDPGNKFDLDEKVVLEMLNVLNDMKDDDVTNYEFFLDYYFTSYKLKENLSNERYRTAKENTINVANHIIQSKNALKKTERCTYNLHCTEFIYLISCNDNSECQVLSNCHQVEPLGKVQQWVKGRKCRWVI